MEQSKPWDPNHGGCSCDPDNLGSLSRYLHLQVLGSSMSVSLCLYSSLYLYYIYIHYRFKSFLWSCIWIYLYLCYPVLTLSSICRFKALLCWRPQVPERRAVDKNPIYGEYAVIYQATEVGSGLDQDSVYPRCKTEMWTTMGRLADLPWLSLVTGTHSITQENEN